MKNRNLHPEVNNILPLFKVLIFLFPFLSFSQADTTITLTYDFNEHEIKEKHDKINPRAHDATLTYDRFGNEKSALQVVGTNGSYLNLGVSPLLKSPNISISLWANVNDRVYLGKGVDAIPILCTKNGPGFDYINALVIAYNPNSKRLAAISTQDSLNEVFVLSSDSITYNRWYHFVLICNNEFLALYIDGKLIGQAPKNFETKFLATDSMVLGHTASTKNLRFMRGIVDDIYIFHRALSPKEIDDLYHQPNPNENKKLLNLIYKLLAVVVGLILVIIIIIIRNRRINKKQKEELELANRISHLELKAVKAQMNPHFISNCMAAIQNLIYISNQEKAGLYVAKFSFFLRQVLNYSDQNYTTLNQEVEMIKLFVELEGLRFKNGFKFDLVIDNSIDTEELLIPALITQPFIENAIWHGLLPLKKMRVPQLTVRIILKNGFPAIEIEDNGIGRDLNKRTKRNSKGTQLVMEKIEVLNRLSKTSNYKIEIVDLVDTYNTKSGTKIIIYLDNLKE